MRMLRVTAPYVTLRVQGDDAAWSVRGYNGGAVLPVDRVHEDSVRHHVDGDMAEVFDTEAEAEPEDVVKPEQGSAPPPSLVKPAQAAPKAEWVDFAVASRAEGVSEEDARAAAEGKSKADLIAEFGS